MTFQTLLKVFILLSQSKKKKLLLMHYMQEFQDLSDLPILLFKNKLIDLKNLRLAVVSSGWTVVGTGVVGTVGTGVVGTNFTRII